MRLTPPEPLDEHHDISGLNCGVASLDDWLRRRARAKQASGATRTFVVTESGRVVAYCVAPSSPAISCLDDFSLGNHVSVRLRK
ncbi:MULTISPECIES: hypothetical protein [unclassified Acidiphilium]|uniref:hypothetical protein n=1 Tax=unclassified Acidiphilium TaxID=2617493 RepID=UPI0025B8667B|nr:MULTISPECIES: hypothetical protein [unclassified Acidiphilium]HQT62694.1 hypothetical protein [Acidiphilium sp.]